MVMGLVGWRWVRWDGVKCKLAARAERFASFPPTLPVSYCSREALPQNETSFYVCMWTGGAREVDGRPTPLLGGVTLRKAEKGPKSYQTYVLTSVVPDRGFGT